MSDEDVNQLWEAAKQGDDEALKQLLIWAKDEARRYAEIKKRAGGVSLSDEDIPDFASEFAGMLYAEYKKINKNVVAWTRFTLPKVLLPSFLAHKRKQRKVLQKLEQKPSQPEPLSEEFAQRRLEVELAVLKVRSTMNTEQADRVWDVLKKLKNLDGHSGMTIGDVYEEVARESDKSTRTLRRYVEDFLDRVVGELREQPDVSEESNREARSALLEYLIRYGPE